MDKESHETNTLLEGNEHAIYGINLLGIKETS
jgi:hypothetical protein